MGVLSPPSTPTLLPKFSKKIMIHNTGELQLNLRGTDMAHRPPTITQPAIARALREAKKQGAEVVEIKPTGELLIHINKTITSPTTRNNAYSIEDFPPLENEQEECSNHPSCPSVDGIEF